MWLGQHEVSIHRALRMVKKRPALMLSSHSPTRRIEAVRDALIGRGVAMGDVDDMGGVKYAGFSDPDGNTWTLQEIPAHV